MSVTSDYLKLAEQMIRDGKGTVEELNEIREGYHDFVKREDFEKLDALMRLRLGFGINMDPELSPPNFDFVEFYRKPVVALNAKVVVETGTGAGRSCDNFVEAVKKTGGWVYSVDNYPDHISVEIVKERHLSQGNPVTFIIGDSIEVGKNWDRGPIDVLYLDSGHEYDFVVAELEAWGKYNPRIILVHDTLEADAGEQGTPVRPMVIQAPYWACKLYAEKHNRAFTHVGCCFTGLGIII